MRREIQDTSSPSSENSGYGANDGFGSGPHVSGSAYKIVNNRAYHHGTMLISSQLETLGKLLHSNKVSRSVPSSQSGPGIFDRSEK